jgi:hypothetical protein
MTTPPQDTAFRIRLEPEVTLEELEQRATRAWQYVQEAHAAGDAAKRDRALVRMTERWEQWMALRPQGFAARWLFKRWAGWAWDALELGLDAETFDRMLEWGYRLLVLLEHDDGSLGVLADADQAAHEMMNRWRLSAFEARTAAGQPVRATWRDGAR